MLLSTFCSLLLIITTFTPADDAALLLKQYQTLKSSIVNQRGLAPGDIETIRLLRDEMSSWTLQNDNFQVVAAELQMSIWLEEIELCNSLFQKLSELQPNNSAVALAWSQFLLSQEGADTDAIYNDLVKRFPNSHEVILGWARSLDAKNQFTKAIIAIEKLNSDSLALPEVAELYSSLLYANNRFEDSIVALDKIDATSLESNPALNARIRSLQSRSQDAIVKWREELSIREVEEIASDLPLVVLQTSKGPIKLELFEDHAPNTVANFISLADTGYYDGVLFHRVIPKFMAQGGDPNSRDVELGRTGEGGPGYTIKDEHTKEDHRNHFAGSLSMAKTSAPNTGGSQFFLTHLPTPHLDGRHTVFGRITSGLDTARAIEKDDEIISVMIIRKRDHDYTPEKLGETLETVIPKVTPKGKPTLTPSLNPK